MDANYRIEIMKKVQSFKVHMNRLTEPIAKEEGLTPLQLFIVVNVGFCHQQSVGSIAKEIEVGQANTSTLCKKLEKDGFLLRERSKEDERTVMLSLTKQGKEVLERVKKKFDMMDEKLKEVPQEKMETIMKGFDEAEKVFHFLVEEMEGKE